MVVMVMSVVILMPKACVVRVSGLGSGWEGKGMELDERGEGTYRTETVLGEEVEKIVLVDVLGWVRGCHDV